MRSKEEAHDYRYFPDPDLLPLELTQDEVDALKAKLPELPDEKKARFMREAGLSAYDAGVLVAERATADFFEAVAKGRDAKLAANWVINELAGRLNKEGRDIASSPVTAAQLGAVLDLIKDGSISGKIAKDLFEIVWSEGGDPRAIVEARGMKQVTDTGAIEKVIDEIIAANPDKVAQAKAKPQGRLVRRPGDESVGRQGQSAGGERSAQGQARDLTASDARPRANPQLDAPQNLRGRRLRGHRGATRRESPGAPIRASAITIRLLRTLSRRLCEKKFSGPESSLHGRSHTRRGENFSRRARASLIRHANCDSAKSPVPCGFLRNAKKRPASRSVRREKSRAR